MYMITTFGHVTRLVSRVSITIACVALLILIGVTLYEVIMRYVFRAPTLWAFDLAWMLNGASFLMAAGYALRCRQHVIIDVFSSALPTRLRQSITAFAYLLLVLPALLLLAGAAWDQTFSAYITREILRASPWQVVIWPFRLAVAAGLSVLALEVLFQGLSEAAAARGRAVKGDDL